MSRYIGHFTPDLLIFSAVVGHHSSLWTNTESFEISQDVVIVYWIKHLSENDQQLLCMATAHETEGGPRAPAEEASVPLNHLWLEELYVALAVWAGVCVPRNWITVFNLAAWGRYNCDTTLGYSRRRVQCLICGIIYLFMYICVCVSIPPTQVEGGEGRGAQTQRRHHLSRPTQYIHLLAAAAVYIHTHNTSLGDNQPSCPFIHLSNTI